MSDQDIPAPALSAIAVDPTGSAFTLTTMNQTGELRAYTVSRPKLLQVFAVIGEALEPGTLEANGYGPIPPTLDDIISGDW